MHSGALLSSSSVAALSRRQHGWLAEAAVVWLCVCPDVHLQDGEAAKKQPPVLPFPAGPCSPGCWSASHFPGRVWKGPCNL